MKHATIIGIMLVTFMACDLAPVPDIQDVGTGVAQSWYTEYLARLEAERAQLKGKPKKQQPVSLLYMH
jgi:hypothetical protein